MKPHAEQLHAHNSVSDPQEKILFSFMVNYCNQEVLGLAKSISIYFFFSNDQMMQP